MFYVVEGRNKEQVLIKLYQLLYVFKMVLNRN